MPTATSLGLGGGPVKFLGAYVKSISTTLGLATSPSTANITLIEDDCVTPPVLFEEPVIGSYHTITVGALEFAGVITQYRKDIANISGRSITVNMSDAREIMQSVPMIVAPGFRQILDELEGTGCSVLDVFGAFDDFETTGINLSGWNQSGLEYEKVFIALNGGSATRPDLTSFQVVRQSATVFGQTYQFDLSELSAKVNLGARINTNLTSLADFIQDLAQNNSFDWYVESRLGTGNRIEIIIKTIDRSVDNIDIDLDSFLQSNMDKVITASSGVELRNEVACSIMYGAPVESLRKSTVLGMVSEKIDLSEEGGTNAYYMEEEEMRCAVANEESWKTWAIQNGGAARYGTATPVIKPLYDILDGDDLINMAGVSKDGYDQILKTINFEERKKLAKMWKKIKGAADATYGKRFVFNTILDVDYIDAAWTVDAVAGGVQSNLGGALTALDASTTTVNASEYFRNDEGKTRCYVEFSAAGVDEPLQELGEFSSLGIFEIERGTTLGRSANAPRVTQMRLKSFDKDDYDPGNLGKENYLLDPGNGLIPDRLFVAATIEKDSNIVKIDGPINVASADYTFAEKQIQARKLQQEGQQQAKGKNAEDVAFGGAGVNKDQENRAKIGQKRGRKYPALDCDIGAYQPLYVYVPTSDKFLRYGPVTSSSIGANSQGRVEVIQDDGFAPWEFGGSTLMIDSMQLKVDNASSSVKAVQSADVAIEGYPEFSIGDSLGKNSNISSINVSIGDGGVRTQYRLQSFLRKFGELSKKDLAALSIFARRSGSRTLPQNTINFINNYRTKIQEQFSGRGTVPRDGITGGATSYT